jgi:hypothetical protein
MQGRLFEMKYIFWIIIILLLFSCSRKNNAVSVDSDSSEITENEQIINETDELAEKSNEVMYVNSQEGLRVRANPDISAEKIYLLKDNQEVRVIETEQTKTIIDDIEGYWAFVETDEISGYVFTGYLTETARISPEFNVFYYGPETIAGIDLPDGKYVHVSRNDLGGDGYDYKIDAIKLYYTQNIDAAYKKIVNKNVRLFKNDSDDDWLYLITEDLKNYGFIRIKDISEESFYGDLEKNASSQNSYRERLNLEYSIIKTNQNIERYGPLLIIKAGNKTIKFLDTFRKWGDVKRYLLIDMFEDNNLLIFEQHWEGSLYFIYNTDKEAQIAKFNESPLFNENNSAFVSYGRMYTESPSFVLYSINNHEYKKEKEADIYTLLDIKKDTYPKYEIEWLNNTTLEIKYENIGSYIVYYEDEKWQEKEVRVQLPSPAD